MSLNQLILHTKKVATTDKGLAHLTGIVEKIEELNAKGEKEVSGSKNPILKLLIKP